MHTLENFIYLFNSSFTTDFLQLKTISVSKYTLKYQLHRKCMLINVNQTLKLKANNNINKRTISLSNFVISNK